MYAESQPDAAALIADHENGIIAVPFPAEWCRRVKTNPFFAKSDFARFQNNQKGQITKRGSQGRTNDCRYPRIGIHQFGKSGAGN